MRYFLILATYRPKTKVSYVKMGPDFKAVLIYQGGCWVTDDTDWNSLDLRVLR